ncbi:MAG: sensor histidine kinase [Ruminococcus sp.]|jgi:two-component system sensor histidine kinase CiaH
MIYRLQRRLILICGVCLVLVFSILFLLIGAASLNQLNKAMDSFIDGIAENGGRPPEPEIKAKNSSDMAPQVMFRENARFDIRFFIAYFDEKGNFLSAEIDDAPEITKEEAEDYSVQAFQEYSGRGWYSGYRYRQYETEEGWTIIFAQGSMNKSMMQMQLLSTGLVLLGAAVVILILIIIFSRYAVRPTAEAYEKQQQFITDANHELKTPLTLIMANLDIIENQIGRNEWIDDIKSEGERMNDLINQLVILTRMDESARGKNYVPFNLSFAVSDMLTEFQMLAEEKGKKIVDEIEREIQYYGEEEEINRLISILLENAVKYCDPGGTIYVKLYGKRHPQIRVENTYQGVDELELDRLFERFYRADRARKYIGGFGIGLSIAKTVVRNHRGEISAYKKGKDTIGFKVLLR